MPNWKKVIVSGSDASLNSLNVSTNVIAQSFTGSLFGTASFATSASQAQNAVSSSFATSASYALSSSYAFNATSASYAVSSSQAISSSYATSASQAISSSYALSSSYAFNATSASYAISASQTISSSFATSSSYAATASSALNASDILVYVKNSSGAQIDKGRVVRIVGAVGDNPLIATASYENDNNSANTLGVTNEDIPNDSFGYVMTEGRLLGVNTNGFTAGQLLYLGATGSIIGTAPVAPLHSVRLGEVLRVQLNNGSIYVRVDNGYELGELHDVKDTTTTSSYGDLLVKSGSIWINSKQLTGSYGLTGSLTATSLSASSLILTNNATITGSLTILQNLTVLGSASITYVSESTLNIGTNLITVNTNLTSSRFGGLAVIDSGSSPQVSGSWLFDSLQNRWIFLHQQTVGSALTSSIGIMGPETYNNEGNETQITFNRLTKGYSGASGEHIGDSQISDDGTTVSIPGNLVITGSITGSLQGTASFAVTSSYALVVSGSVTSSMIANPGGAIILYPSGGSGINTSSVVMYGGIDWVRTPTAQQTEIGDLISFGGTMGVIDGGALTTASALTIQVGTSVGYVMTTGNYPNHNLSKIFTLTSSAASRQITIPANAERYLFYNSSGVLTASAAEPNSRFNVILGRVITDDTSVAYIDQTPLDAHHYANYIDRMFRDALGVIYQAGGITTEGTTPRTLDVTAATYFFSEHRITTTGATPITFDAFYRSGSAGTGVGGSGFTRQINQVTASNIYYDSASSGVLQLIPSGSYTKHSLYMLGVPDDKYVLVYGQALYDNAEAAEAGPLPTPPSFIGDQFGLFASIIVTPDSASLQGILDERPRLGFASPSRTGVVTLHANLLGLTSDDHPQYLLVDGGRQMSSDLGIGGNDIYNVSSITSSYITASSAIFNGLTVSGSTTITGSLGVGTTSSAVIGRIDAANDVVAFATSDIRLKENLKPIPNALYKLDNIQGYSFSWKTDEELTSQHGFSGRDIGVIAQEIEEILPEVVSTRGNGYKAVKYEKLVPFLIQCIKELKDEIEILKGTKKPKKTRKPKTKDKPE